MVKLTVRKVGSSLGVTLPAKAARALRVREGDQLYLTETPDGFRLTAYDPEFAETMEIAESFVRRYKSWTAQSRNTEPIEA
jgi:putative addiction module antidote